MTSVTPPFLLTVSHISHPHYAHATHGIAPHYTSPALFDPRVGSHHYFYLNLLGSAIAISDFLYFFSFPSYHSRLSSLGRLSLITLNLSSSIHVSPRLKSLFFFYKSLPKHSTRLLVPHVAALVLVSLVLIVYPTRLAFRFRLFFYPYMHHSQKFRPVDLRL